MKTHRVFSVLENSKGIFYINPALHNEKELGRQININFYNSFKNIHKHLKANLCNGIVLAGGIEL